jgi:hypothetical protein
VFKTTTSIATATITLCVLIAGSASAEPPAPPQAPQVYHVPTAWLQPHAGVYGTAGANHRGGTTVSVTAGLGNIAELDISISDRFVMCGTCEGDSRETQEAYIASAKFKVGVDQGVIARHAPAMALGFRRSLYGAERETEGMLLQPEFGEMYLAVSYHVARLELHLGAELWDALSDEDGPALHEKPLSDQVRPFGGLSYRPARYPRTSMMIDFGWVPEFRVVGPELEWIGGIGVRYQALSWGSVELAVRARENGAIEDAVAFLRFNGTFGASR